MFLDITNGVRTGLYRVTTDAGVRPLIRLKSNIKMNWNGATWDLSE